MEVDNPSKIEWKSRSRRSRNDSTRGSFGCHSNDNNLELNGVLSVLDEYDSYEGGINCRVCGKLYKSKVCFTKHLWEHTVYWEVFKGEKNHDRVLSIQAAIILWNQSQGNGAGRFRDKSSLESLLVTSPHKKEKDDVDMLEKMHVTKTDVNAAPKKIDSRGKRKQLFSDSGVIPDSFQSSSSSHSDVGSPAKITRQS